MNYLQARTELFSIAQAVLNGYETPVPTQYPDLPFVKPVAGPWARVTMNVFGGGQASLANAEGAKRWDNPGTLFVQVFAPMGDGSIKVHQIAGDILNAYRKARGIGTWLRNPRLRTPSPDPGAFASTQVLVDFTYDDIQ